MAKVKAGRGAPVNVKVPISKKEAAAAEREEDKVKERKQKIVAALKAGVPLKG
jgi:hypothetical protein